MEIEARRGDCSWGLLVSLSNNNVNIWQCRNIEVYALASKERCEIQDTANPCLIELKLVCLLFHTGTVILFRSSDLSSQRRSPSPLIQFCFTGVGDDNKRAYHRRVHPYMLVQIGLAPFRDENLVRTSDDVRSLRLKTEEQDVLKGSSHRASRNCECHLHRDMVASFGERSSNLTSSDTSPGRQAISRASRLPYTTTPRCLGWGAAWRLDDLKKEIYGLGACCSEVAVNTFFPLT